MSNIDNDFEFFKKYVEPCCEFCCEDCDTSDVDNIKYCKQHEDKDG